MEKTPTYEYYKRLVQNTRTHGECYLHKGMPATFTADGVTFTVTSYGRSWSAGGHKSKCFAHDADGAIVKSKNL